MKRGDTALLLQRTFCGEVDPACQMHGIVAESCSDAQEMLRVGLEKLFRW